MPQSQPPKCFTISLNAGGYEALRRLAGVESR